jgi:hypothetical protein
MSDDGFERSLRRARVICGAICAAPVLLAAASWVALARGRVPHEEPLIVAVLVILVVLLVAAAPVVREEIARKGIAEALGRAPDARSPQTVYPTFTTAVVAAFVVLVMPVLFGFISTVLTVSVVPLSAGAVVSCGGWALLWPRRVLWERWTWQAKLRRGDDAGHTGPAR